MGRVVQPDNTNFNGCYPFTLDQFGITKDESHNLFILVERGHCSNPTKVRNIENFGGSVALIADNRSEDIADAVMIDHNGSGHSLVTPGFMIDKKSGEQISEALSKGDTVMMNASLEIHNRGNEVTVGMLFGSALDLEADSLRSFTELALESAKTR